MASINKIINFLIYHFDNLRSKRLFIKIERFDLDKDGQIIVFYRLGRQHVLNKASIFEFERAYFDKASNYDQHRLTKFASYQKIGRLFEDNSESLVKFTRFIKEEVKNEQLF